MTKFLDFIKNKLQNENGIISIGFSDIIGSGVASIFWLYIASVIEPGDYGEIHYFLGIAGMAHIFSMIGSSHALTVFSAKEEKSQSTLFLLSIIDLKTILPILPIPLIPIFIVMFIFL